MTQSAYTALSMLLDSRDGTPAVIWHGNGRGAPVSKVDKTLANAAALREMLKEGGTL